MKITDKIELYNCDNMELMAKYPDGYFDLCICDPPYGLERMSRKGNDKNNRISLVKAEMFNDNKPTDEYWSELFRISKNQIVWGANNFVLPPTEYFLIWNKKQTVENFASAEYAWVSMGLKKPALVFDYGIHKHNHTDKIHPTQKPIDLYKFILDKYAKPNDKILDTHLGSMSIAIAAHDYGFELVGCELDKEYYDKGIERVKNHVNQLKVQFPD